MTIANTLYELAALSQASYAFIRNDEGPASDAQVIVATQDARLQGDRFSREQASALIGAAGYTAVHHVPNDPFGFSATLFKDNRSGQLTLAIRGSEGSFASFLPVDGSDPDRRDANAEIINPSKGMARNQIVSLYNYVQRLYARTTDIVPQYEMFESDALPAAGAAYCQILRPELANPLRYVSFRRITDQPGLELAVGALNVTGHSLGGHLAMAFSRLFPERTAGAFTFNAAGFGRSSLEIDPFFNLLAGRSTSFSGSIQNLYAYAGPEIVTNDMVFTQPGQRTGLYIEGNVDSVAALHAISRLSDSLAVQSLFSTIDSGLAPSSLNQLLEMASDTAKKTLEASVESLYKLFVGMAVAIPMSDRDALHARISEVRQSIAQAALVNTLQLKSLASESVTADQARGDIAARYALKELNPFVVTGVDYQGLHNANGALDLYDPSTDRGTLTDKWLEARAELLSTKLAYNLTDGAIGGVLQGRHFEDKALDYKLGVPFLNKHIVFGSESVDTLSGSSSDDKLFGGSGGDTISSGPGDDYIEGNDGFDTIDAGVGDDEVYGGEGNDTISGFTGVDKLYGGTGEDAINGGVGDDIIYGDKKDDADSTSITGGDTIDGGWGADQIWGGGGVDTIHGGRGDDKIEGNAGDDTLYGDEGVDTVKGGAGIDTIYGGDGADTIEGGEDGDIIYGGSDAADRAKFGNTLTGDAGDDKLYGDGGADVIYGGAGADFVDGAEGNDVLFGEAGDDVLIGGAGQDFLSGGADTVSFGAGIAPEDVRFAYRAPDTSGGYYGPAFTIDYGAGTIAVVGGEYGAIERYRFDDGTVLSHAQLLGQSGALRIPPPDSTGEDIRYPYGPLAVGEAGVDSHGLGE